MTAPTAPEAANGAVDINLDALTISEKAAGPNEFVSIVVVGATGDLAARKIFPALFSLYSEGHFPKNFQLVGFARSSVNLDNFKAKVGKRLVCRPKVGEEVCSDDRKFYLSKLSYFSGNYDSEESFAGLHKFLLAGEKAFSPTAVAHRLYYFSIPPSVFLDTARGISRQAMAPEPGWTRVIVEKPFGKDRQSSDELSAGLKNLFKEKQLYRIDHYLGKEVVQNTMVIRFANVIFEPLWNRNNIANVQIIFKEELGVEGRGGYFDEYGIIRDVMQNHLLQIVALIAMEPPVALDAEDVRDEKVKLVQAIAPITPDDIVVGQYTAAEGMVGYLEDPTVPKDSITPTFAAAVLKIRNRRWEGVPFILACGKGLDGRLAELRIQFHTVPGTLFRDSAESLPRNELVIRVQPGEAMFLSIVDKVDSANKLEVKHLDLEYGQSFKEKDIPDAYERLLLEALNGDKSLFIRSDELEAAWDVFTPVLHHLERNKVKPVQYPYGTTGPREAVDLASKYGVNVNL